MKTSKRQPAIILTLALAAAVPAALAGDDKDAAKKFQKLDANGDGRISSTEYTSDKAEKKHWWNRSNNSAADASAHTTEQFAVLDKDQDGFLSATELAAHIEDKDGSLSPTGRSSDYSPRDSASPNSSAGPDGSTNSGPTTSGSATPNSGSSTNPTQSDRPSNSDGADRTK